ncbi:hypothetical protein M422DRAFT_43561 [Sphaerobolus stellatus SS14]|nr:hypothetical protein M422DRAFT_43561 [Sphaerobolus stellatus SS14]
MPHFITVEETIMNKAIGEEFGRLIQSSVLSTLDPADFHAIVKAFSEGSHSGLSLQQFRIDIQGPVEKGWNLRLAQVFMLHFLCDIVPKFTPNSFPAKLLFPSFLLRKLLMFIRWHFLTPKDSPREVRTKYLSSRGQPLNIDMQNRQRNLHKTRQDKVIVKFAAPNVLWDILEALGPGGMSSDETDAEALHCSGVYQFLRIPKMFRSKPLDWALSYIDDLPKHGLLEHIGSRKGTPEQTRIADHPTVCNTVGFSGLPVDFYNSEWLAEHNHLSFINALPPLNLEDLQHDYSIGRQ